MAHPLRDSGETDWFGDHGMTTVGHTAPTGQPGSGTGLAAGISERPLL